MKERYANDQTLIDLYADLDSVREMRYASVADATNKADRKKYNKWADAQIDEIRKRIYLRKAAIDADAFLNYSEEELGSENSK